jgi:uncharacterized protein (TIGR02001 family)
MRLVLAAAAALLPSVALAEGPTVSYGIGVTSDYVSDGFSYSDGPAVQPYVEVSFNSGLFVGLWASTIDGSLGGVEPDDNMEFDLYAGYRFDTGKLSWEAKYTRYLYDQSGDCCGEAEISVSYPIVDPLHFSTHFTTDFDGTEAIKQGFGLTLPQDFEVTGEVKYIIDNYTNWNVGVTKSLNDLLSLDARYYDSDIDGPLFAVTLSIDFETGGSAEE